MPLKSQLKPGRRLSILGLAMMLLSLTTWADVDIATRPLTVADPVPPNIFFILDDSGSMNRDDMPDTTGCSGATGGTSNVIRSDTGRLRTSGTPSTYNRCQSPDFNKLYYNPSFTYTVPVDASGVTLIRSPANTFTYAYVDGYNTSNTLSNDLTEWVAATWSGTKSTYTSGWICTTRSGSSPNYTYSGCAEASVSSPIYGYKRLTQVEIFSYYLYDGSGDTASDTNYVKHLATDAERQNIANWYAYYRTRLFTARAGTSLAFKNIPSNYRVGYGSINHPYSSSYSTIISGVRPYSSLRSSFYSWLFDVTPATSTYYYTPLRRALDNVGKYYETDEPWRVDPGDASSTKISCRSCFSILMTDGYWTGGTTYQAGTTAARANVDGSNGSLITGPNNQSFTYTATSTFSDTYSNTLADVAMYYWKRDLRTDLTNNVPISDINPAFWQHVVTIGIGLGVDGGITKKDAFAALTGGTAISWPNPLQPDTSDTSSNPSKIDDLLHAAINSRGIYFSSKSSQEFTEGLKQSLANIEARLATGNSVSIDSATLAAGATLYKANFRSVVWSGELAAYALDANGNPADTPTWLASAKLPAHASRNLHTRVGGTAVALTWANLSSTQKTALGTESILNYLRGDQSLEVANNGTLRTRNSPLGDIVNSNPVFVGKPDPYLFQGRAWIGASTHDDFAADQASRTNMVYVGANDGMLHGFNASTGVEVFAYMPEAVVNATLATLANPEYSHRYFVDGELTVADAYVGGGWKSILVGALGRGGKTLFGINVTNPASINAASMLWETNSSAMGQNVGKPMIVRLPNGAWAAVLGNGYNSGSQQAALMVVNLADGGVTTIGTGVGSAANPNGLAGAYPWDANNDGNFETAYAGDLQGNVWRFDLVANTATKLFQALDTANQPQPITASVRVSKDPDTLKTWVFFGTGKFLGDSDLATRQIQTWYGLIDDQTAISGRGVLVQRSIVADVTFGANTARTISEAAASDLIGRRGWYIDLAVDGVARGERMVLPNQIVGASSLVGVSLIPIGDTCNPGGQGFIMVINPFTGGRLGYNFFDYSGDGALTTADLVNGIPGSGISFGNIPSTPAFKGDRMIVQTDQGQIYTMKVAPPYPAGETQRVMWHELTDD